jgi:hypothetical protein
MLSPIATVAIAFAFIAASFVAVTLRSDAV